MPGRLVPGACARITLQKGAAGVEAGLDFAVAQKGADVESPVVADGSTDARSEMLGGALRRPAVARGAAPRPRTLRSPRVRD